MILRTRKRYAAELKHERDHGYALGNRDARQRALDARDHGYMEGRIEGRIAGIKTAVPAVLAALETTLTAIERQDQQAVADLAEATTRWERRLITGRLQALATLHASVTAQLEEIRES